VEDNSFEASLCQEALQQTDMPNTVHVVDSGEKALDYIYGRSPYKDAKRPDMILLDLNLPKMSGLDVLRQIKDDPKVADIPVIVLSASDSERDIARSYAFHANSYVVKPLDFHKFAEVVRNIQEFWFQIAQVPMIRK